MYSSWCGKHAGLHTIDNCFCSSLPGYSRCLQYVTIAPTRPTTATATPQVTKSNRIQQFESLTSLRVTRMTQKLWVSPCWYWQRHVFLLSHMLITHSLLVKSPLLPFKHHGTPHPSASRMYSTPQKKMESWTTRNQIYQLTCDPAAVTVVSMLYNGWWW